VHQEFILQAAASVGKDRRVFGRQEMLENNGKDKEYGNYQEK